MQEPSSYDNVYDQVLRYTADETPSLFDNSGWNCPSCNEEHPDEDDAKVETDDGEVGCTSCVENCHHCDNPFYSNDMTAVSDSGSRRGRRNRPNMWCQGCTDDNSFSCGDCGAAFDNDADSGVNPSGESVCAGCAEDYFTCSNCGDTHSVENYGDDGICQDCLDNDESAKVHEYDYKPRPIMHGDGRHYGVELETVTRGRNGDLPDNADFVLDTLNDGESKTEGFAYLKKDGSLHNGFEIVTHPATLDIHKEKWAPLFEDAPAELVSNSEDGNCGLHIHVEKKNLSTLTIGKMLSFVNSPDNKKFINAVARRESGYGKLDPKKKPQDALKENDDRFEAINLQNEKTVEFRIFGGTLDKDEFFTSLEFVDALVEYCKPANTSVGTLWHTPSFIKYVAANNKQYPHLTSFCEKHTGTPLTKKKKPAPEKNSRESIDGPTHMTVSMKFKKPDNYDKHLHDAMKK